MIDKTKDQLYLTLVMVSQFIEKGPYYSMIMDRVEQVCSQYEKELMDADNQT